MRRGLLAAAVILLSGAGPVRAQADRAFDPLAFFAGRTHSEGAMTGLDGRTTRFSGDTRGRREPDGATAFDQTIRFADGTVRRRSFRLVRTGVDTIAVTGSEVVGTGEGRIAGPVLSLSTLIRADAGNPLGVVAFDQSFTAAPGGRQVRNVSTVTLLGAVVARADETFVRLGGGGGR